MKLNKLLFTAIFAMLMVVLIACGGNDADDDSANADGAEDEEVTLHLAALESAYGKEVWENIVEDYEAKHENVTIDLTAEKNLEEVVRPEMQAGDYPDVFLLATDRDEALTETMIKEEGMEDLTEIIDMDVDGEDVTVNEKLLDGFTDTLATNPYGDGETYMMPMFYSPSGLFYNETLLEDHDWDVPETWDEMFDLAEETEKEDIPLFTYPLAGYFDTMIGSMLYASGGPDFFEYAMTYEDGVCDTNDFTKNQQLILDNEAVFMPNGSWVIDEMSEAPREDDFEWGMTSVPAFEDGDGEQYAFTFFEQMWIPKEAENKEAAKEFITYLYSDEAVDTFLEAGAVQPVEDIVDELDDEKATYYSIYEEEGALPAMGTFASTDSVEGVDINDSLYESVDSLMNGDMTYEEWQQEVEEASDKLRDAKK